MINTIGKGLFYLGTMLFIVCSLLTFKYGADAALFLITIGVMILGLGISFFSRENSFEGKSTQPPSSEELNELIISLKKEFDDGGGILYMNKILGKKFDWELSLWGNDWVFHKDDDYHYLWDVSKYTYNITDDIQQHSRYN